MENGQWKPALTPATAQQPFAALAADHPADPTDVVTTPGPSGSGYVVDLLAAAGVNASVLISTGALLLLLRLLLLRGIRGHRARGGAVLRLPGLSWENSDLCIADLPGEIALNLACLAAALAAALTTDLLPHPLSVRGYSSLVHYSLLVSAAGHAYGVVSYWVCGRCGGGNVLEHTVHRPAAIVVCVTVVLTRENAMLGVAAFSYQTAFSLCEALRLVLGPSVMTSSAALILSILLNVLLPIGCLALSLVREIIPANLSLWSTGVFSVVTVYFGLFAIYLVVMRSRAVYRDVTMTSREYVCVIPTEKSNLLGAFPGLGAQILNGEKRTPETVHSISI